MEDTRRIERSPPSKPKRPLPRSIRPARAAASVSVPKCCCDRAVLLYEFEILGLIALTLFLLSLLQASIEKSFWWQ
ncbi:hypothetical protein OPV22_029800 [Ensete ventricosum]|uniref:Uncharacterized protein n=1 Tax=Ensete ventricosum TaxID=4639 RepID=A0AAV8QAB8_ENSVE|nr:hypothetical protein OPV22_029800 [Ensete ventricosum]